MPTVITDRAIYYTSTNYLPCFSNPLIGRLGRDQAVHL